MLTYGQTDNRVKQTGNRPKDKMWQLYQEGYTFVKIADKLKRSPGTVSRYVHEYEAAVSAVSIVMKTN